MYGAEEHVIYGRHLKAKDRIRLLDATNLLLNEEARKVRFSSAIQFNDHHSTTHGDVLAFLGTCLKRVGTKKDEAIIDRTGLMPSFYG